MQSKFLPQVKLTVINAAINISNTEELYDLLVQPIHEKLYEKQTFEFFDELSDGQQLLVAYDYLRMQSTQGGFIQFIHNGYVALLPDIIKNLTNIGCHEMAKLLDDVLKVFVLNKDYFFNAKTVEEFAKIYEELQEFEILDERFLTLHPATTNEIIKYAINNLSEFANIV